MLPADGGLGKPYFLRLRTSPGRCADASGIAAPPSSRAATASSRQSAASRSASSSVLTWVMASDRSRKVASLPYAAFAIQAAGQPLRFGVALPEEP